MDRRAFLAGGMAAGMAVGGNAPAEVTMSQGTEVEQVTTWPFADIPNFCSHEHWGSISSLGWDGGFRADMVLGAQPTRRTIVMDILIDPYLGGNLANAGADVNAMVHQSLGVDSVHAVPSGSMGRAMKAIRPALMNQELTGIYQCIRRGLMFAYGRDVSLDDASEMDALDAAIAASYSDIFAWYVQLMKRANFTELIRPVHPEFFLEKESEVSARAEQAFTHTVMRIDALMSMWKKSSRRDKLAAAVGVEPADAASWRAFLDGIFKLARDNGCLGIKQAQAYRRSLLFEERPDSDVTFGGQSNHAQARAFEDWIMHECCRRAHDLGWPQQIHVGTHNLPHSNPLPLERIARRYGRQKIVMLHCWPYLEESGYLARQRANVYIDTCWQPLLNPAFMEHALTRWLGYLPTSKLTMGNDATSIEMAVGAVGYSRRILQKVLRNPALGDLDQKRIRSIAADLLNNNAVSLYAEGQKV